ncbi:MAG: diaminopimelate decarboxylase [Phoenicibacter congonensis]|uniref:Diaminopimelate decarboxylase n=1 Tax=Phoenicibacter congonensis TaxID=1944646 RepID=A0AA43RI19_9ACTN|nr:diaminopimelate decarboxylase [Phoenicibacter congonensis]
MLHKNLSVNSAGHLEFAGVDTTEIAKEYGTPAYLVDENLVLENFSTYQKAMKEYMGEGSMPLFASKALSYTGIYRLISELNGCIDIVSPGELYTAVNAGFDMSRAFFHGSNKTDADIAFGLKENVGYFVVDNVFELEEISKQASALGKTQKILLRVTPGIDPHTHAKINTGKVDSKFGAPIETGIAEKLFCKVLETPNVQLEGFHSHIGSQIFETEPFSDAARIMLEFIAMLHEKYQFETNYLNLGGGFGVRYTEDDPVIDYAERIKKLSGEIREHCEDFGIKQPNILMEPGRSIVAAAGLTIYEIGSTKEIEGFKNYASIDGGMTDNPRYALYQSPYTCVLANRMNDECDFVCTIAGRCCESGDLIQENVAIPKPTRGDILAVLVTGAYNYSMASNYNRVPRPPIIAIRDGKPRVAVRRETYADLCALDA